MIFSTNYELRNNVLRYLGSDAVAINPEGATLDDIVQALQPQYGKQDIVKHVEKVLNDHYTKLFMSHSVNKARSYETRFWITSKGAEVLAKHRHALVAQ